MKTHVPPSLGAAAFTCPECGAYAQQRWLRFYTKKGKTFKDGRAVPEPLADILLNRAPDEAVGMSGSVCAHCANLMLWLRSEIAIQSVGRRTESPIPTPAKEMPDEVRVLYLEARRVFYDSPRAAAALLRLALDKLTIHVGAQGSTLNERINNIATTGPLSGEAVRLLHAIRLVGNESVHPGKIDLKDTAEMTVHMFAFLNRAVDDLIVHRTALETVLARFPPPKKQEPTG